MHLVKIFEKINALEEEEIKFMETYVEYKKMRLNMDMREVVEIKFMESYVESKKLRLDMDISELYELRDDELRDDDWYTIHPFYEWDEKLIGKWVFAPPFP